MRMVLKVCRSEGCGKHLALLWEPRESGSYVILKEPGVRVEAGLPKALNAFLISTQRATKHTLQRTCLISLSLALDPLSPLTEN